MITRSSTRKIGRSKCRDIDCDVQDNVNLDETTGEILDKSPVEDNESVCDTVVETMNEGGTVAAIPPTSEEKYSSSEEVEPQPNSDNVKDEVDGKCLSCVHPVVCISHCIEESYEDAFFYITVHMQVMPKVLQKR